MLAAAFPAFGIGFAGFDHVAYTIANWDQEKETVAAELKRRNLASTGDAKTSFHVKDRTVSKYSSAD